MTPLQLVIFLAWWWFVGAGAYVVDKRHEHQVNRTKPDWTVLLISAAFYGWLGPFGVLAAIFSIYQRADYLGRRRRR